MVVETAAKMAGSMVGIWVDSIVGQMADRWSGKMVAMRVGLRVV